MSEKKISPVYSFRWTNVANALFLVFAGIYFGISAAVAYQEFDNTGWAIVFGLGSIVSAILLITTSRIPGQDWVGIVDLCMMIMGVIIMLVVVIVCRARMPEDPPGVGSIIWSGKAEYIGKLMDLEPSITWRVQDGPAGIYKVATYGSVRYVHTGKGWYRSNKGCFDLTMKSIATAIDSTFRVIIN